MGTLLAGVAGVLIYETVSKLTDKATNVGILSLILVAVFVLLPINVSLPSDVVSVLTSSNAIKIFNTMSLLFPVSFILMCLCSIFLCRHLDSIYSLIGLVYNHLIKGLIS